MARHQTPSSLPLHYVIMTASTTASAPTHMGTPPPGYHQEWVTHTVHVHGFENLPAVRRVASPEFILLGNEWLLRIYPGGDDDAAEGMVTVGLQNMSNKAIDIDLGFSVNDGNGMQVAYGQSDGPRNFGIQTITRSKTFCTCGHCRS